MNWQKRARLGVAVFGIATAVFVYAVTGERAKPVPAAPPQRLDPAAMIESRGNVLQQVRGTKQDYLIEAKEQLTYEGGRTRLIDVKVTVRNRSGRDYTITAHEAEAGQGQEDLHLRGDVKLIASDGFTIATDEAFFTGKDGTVRAPGGFSFSRGRMAGTGAGMAYDKNDDLLTIDGSADVKLTDEGGNTLSQFSAGSALFARPMHLLTLNGSVHALHNEQVIDAGNGTAQLSEDDSLIQTIALREKASVSGGGQGLESLSAEAIDLDYADDGTTLEHAVLAGAGHVAMAGDEGASGRQISGERLDMTLAPDGAIESLAGRNGVQLDLPGTAQAPSRSIKGRSLDGSGESGKGLTSARFQDAVEYREDARADAAGRLVKSRALQVTMANDVVAAATFTGGVCFDEQGLQAAGGEARYDPSKGSLRLLGGAEKLRPRVADEQVLVDATTIDVALADRKMTADGAVKTTLRPPQAATAICGGRPLRRGPASRANAKLPGLLTADAPVTVAADRFEYAGADGDAVYSGDAALVQGEMAIRADRIGIDQAAGDLTAAGGARSTLVLDTGRSIGSADRIAYADATRLITYDSTPPAAARGGAAAARRAPAALAQLGGPQGDLRAERIEVVLAAGGSKADRIEAYTNVTMAVDKRTATGARLTYFAADERYLMTSAGATPVKVVADCREISGRTLTFFKSTDRIIVDGNEEIRTQTTTGGGTCSQPRRISR